MPRLFAAALACLLLVGCTSFPDAVRDGPPPADGMTAQAHFDRMLAAHGGDLRRYPGDVNLSTDGRWYGLVQRLQPIVTDARFRVGSEERYHPSDGVYAVRHSGPDGVKHVVRTPDALRVAYNGRDTADASRRDATAMTNDAFRMFHFGPSYFLDRMSALSRLSDTRENGRRYVRLLATLQPGFGRSAQDRVVMWIDADTARLYRVHLTLEGFPSTAGAHADVTFLQYREAGGYLFPVDFLERVRGPVPVKAHRWRVTGLDMGRGWTAADVADVAGFRGAAAAPAAALER